MDARRVDQAELDAAERLTGEQLTVWRHRYREARAAGFTEIDAELFADSTADVGELRRLRENGCPPHLIARILA